MLGQINHVAENARDLDRCKVEKRKLLKTVEEQAARIEALEEFVAAAIEFSYLVEQRLIALEIMLDVRPAEGEAFREQIKRKCEQPASSSFDYLQHLDYDAAKRTLQELRGDNS